MKNNKNIFITGANGFIGSYLCKNLTKNGYNVFGLFLTNKNQSIELLKNQKKIHLKKGNILNFNLISNIIRKNKIGTVVHLAALLPSENDLRDPFLISRVNAFGTLNLLNAAYRNKVKKFIFASTMSVYSEPPEYLPVDENHPTKPSTMYGASKLSGEIFCNVYSKFMKITVLRYGGTYGLGQHKHNAVYRFIQQALKNKPITIYGTGSQTTDFTYIGDIVQGTILAMKKNKPGIYNIGSGQETSIRDLAHKIIKLSKSKSKIILVSKNTDRPFRFFLDIKKAKKILGYSPVSLERGLSEYISKLEKK